MKTYKLTIFGVKETTKIIAEHLYHAGIPVDLMVSIASSVLEKNEVSNYMDLADTARRIGADFICVSDYSLQHLKDDFFDKNAFELGIVYGWQRLIPEYIINKFKDGLFGFHASPDLLPKGRGRSPLNWGVILGKTKLYNHLFKYAPEADAGDVYSITPFMITPHDTVLTLLYKSLFIAKQETVRLIHDINAGNFTLTPQTGASYFFPKRSPKDGLIDFKTSSTDDIVNLVRGVTKPFPGAYCFTDQGEKIVVFEAWAFDDIMDFSRFEPGEVIDNLYKMPVVKTVDGSLIIKQYEGRALYPKDRLVSYELK